MCSDPDFVDCRYECCVGDLCNNFDFTNDVGSKIQPTIAMTAQKYQQLVQTERNEDEEDSIEVTQVSTSTPDSESAGDPPITKQSLRTTSNKNQGGLKLAFFGVYVVLTQNTCCQNVG